ncbi:hypothetical protein BYT27DRAFT_7195192 [Phlegmacium glaucopus]|nr:hypothetical protein BYT27DRAFT_7195192 [Phlegmacium glaucopus]
MLSLNGTNSNSKPPPAFYPGSNDLIHFCQRKLMLPSLFSLMFDLEVEYIWKRRWSNFKILFILARYFGDLLLICDVGFKFVGTGSMVIILITQVIMQLRIKAMYGNIMSRLITTFWILEVMAVVALGVASLVVIDVTPYTLEGSRMCNPTYLPPFAFLFWVPIIVFETFLVALAFRMAYYNYLEIGSWRGVSIFHVVLRDNFIFFIFAFASYLVTAMTWLTANPRYFTVPGSFTCSLTSVMGCRLILNLCRVYYAPKDVGVRPRSIWAASHGIRFKPPVSNSTGVSSENCAMESNPSSTTRSKSPTGDAYELSGGER